MDIVWDIWIFEYLDTLRCYRDAERDRKKDYGSVKLTTYISQDVAVRYIYDYIYLYITKLVNYRKAFNRSKVICEFPGRYRVTLTVRVTTLVNIYLVI